MPLTVRERADTVATWRHVSVHLMETLARWVPTSPELEAKALFGRHIWDLAQLADQLGHRTPELRAALHESRAPHAAYQRAIADLPGLAATADRLACMYDAVLPDLRRRFATYLKEADPLLDEPTVRILERAVADLGRMDAQRADLLAERPDLAPGDQGRVQRLQQDLAAAELVERRAAEPGDAA